LAIPANLTAADPGGNPPRPPSPRLGALRALILAYGAGTMVSQVLVLRELLVLGQGVELKLALGLWCWLLWTGLGSLWGGRRESRRPAVEAADPSTLTALLGLLGLLLPGTVLLIRALPALPALPGGAPLFWGQSLPLSRALWLFLVLLAPFGLVSGYFFPCACRVLASLASGETPGEAPGRVYYLETLGAALGVLLLQLLLLGRFPSLALSLATGLLLALSSWLLFRPLDRPPDRPPDRARVSASRLAAGAGLLLLAAACLFLPRLEARSRAWQWPGRRVIATTESPYALLTATREAEQVSFFANNLWQFTYPDPLTAEHQVQFGMLEHSRPRRVLLLGGGLGLAPEILKTATVARMDYVELDPQLVQLTRRLLPQAEAIARDPRVHIVYQDARRFLDRTGERYDVILITLPEPKNAQLNRFYTREFFRIAARRLAPRGVFTFALTGAETSLHPLRAAYLAMTYHTLGQAFPEVLVFPGERARFLASVSPGTLISDPEILVRRLRERRLNLQYVREYYLLSDLSRPRQEYLRQILSQVPTEINTDLSPGCYFYDLMLSAVQEGLPANRVLLFLKRLPPSVPWLALLAGLLLPGVLVRRRTGGLYLYQVMVMGLGAMALEVLVLILYQIRFGYLYRQLGMLIAAFMVGMAAGSAAGGALWTRWGGGKAGGGGRVGRSGPGLVAALQGAMAGLAVIMALGLSAGPAPPWPDYLAQAAYALVLAAGGCAGGGIFALSAALWAQGQPGFSGGGGGGGWLYAADLLGATLGTLGVSLLVLPVWGILPALYLVAALQAGAGLLLLWSRRPATV
jgi:spermidine synthase